MFLNTSLLKINNLNIFMKIIIIFQRKKYKLLFNKCADNNIHRYFE